MITHEMPSGVTDRTRPAVVRGLRRFVVSLPWIAVAVVWISMALALQPAPKAVSIGEGPRLIREGKLDEALKVYLQGVETVPKSVPANNGAGVVLDLLGRYVEARKYFGQAVKAAGTPLEKAQAQRALAVSYAFARDCRGAEKSE